MAGTKLICTICTKTYGFIPMFRGETFPAPRFPVCAACASAMLGPGHHLCQDCGSDEGAPQLVRQQALGPNPPPPTVHIEYRCNDCTAEVEAEAKRQAMEYGIGDVENDEEDET
jgi:hypothetical protein